VANVETIFIEVS